MRGRYLIAAMLLLVPVGLWSQQTDEDPDRETSEPIYVVVEDDDAVLIIGDDPEEDKLPEIVFRRSSDYIGEDEDFVIEWGEPQSAPTQGGALSALGGFLGVGRGSSSRESASAAGSVTQWQSGGIGAAYLTSILGGPGSSAMLTWKMGGGTVVFGAAAEFGFYTTAGVTLDWRALQRSVSGNSAFYLGPGIYFSTPQGVRVGPRIPVGIGWYPRERIEMFLEIAPAGVFWIYQGNWGFTFRLQLMSGIRYLFSKDE